MTSYKFRLVGSLTKVLPTQKPKKLPGRPMIGFLGEKVSFQLAYSCQTDDRCCGWFTAKPRSDLELQVRRVELVPSEYPCHSIWDDNYLCTAPGLYPDLLTPTSWEKDVQAFPNQWRSLWIDVPLEAAVTPGIHDIALDCFDRSGNLLDTLTCRIQVIGEMLPKQTLCHTEWFHGDCLADYYHVPVFSEEHWRILGNFMKSAADHGCSMILTPLFTPPLDTARGGERTTIQLVGVRKNQGKYIFDFSKLDRWIDLCEKSGIPNLEMSHLFTQWGAECAPKIIGSVDGGPKEKLFGWHTPAVGEYTTFLRAFLPELKTFLRAKGWLDRAWFHISDEPNTSNVDTYQQAKASLGSLLDGCRVMDAMSHYEIYEQCQITRPVVCVDCIQDYLNAEVPHLWAYYCTSQALAVPNRFMAMPSPRNRILGVLLYYFNIEGFLHWGFNFYNSQFSLRHIDPFRVTDAGGAFPSGDPFLVYPAPDGTAWESIRGVILQEALNDVRMLKLLEARIGRAEVLSLIEKTAGGKLSFGAYPRKSRFFEDLRNSAVRKLS